ncbi:ABC transporter substrate-binding protein [Pseudomonadota bacterium]
MQKSISCIVIVCVLLLMACGQPSGDAIRMGIANAPVNLDPRFATDATSSRINRLLYERLVDFDDASRPIPALAQGQQLSPIHYRFILKEEGRAFHNDGRLTAKDVKATYDFILDQDNASPHRATLAMIDRVEIQGDDQIDFFLTRADSLFPAYLAIGILPADLMSKNHPFQNQPVGSGSFQFIDWPEEGRLILKRRRDGQRLEFLKVSEGTVRILKLLRGEIDMIQNDLSPELLAYLKQKQGVHIEQVAGSNFSYLGFNLQDAETGQLKVRQAIAHAIDRDAIIHYVMQGAASQAQAMFPSSHWAGAKNLPPYNRDLKKAKALLQEAGYDEQHPLQLVYKTSSDPFRVRLATVIQSQLAEAGVEVDLRSYDWATVYGDIKAGRFQMYSLAWVGVKTPDIFRYVFHSDAVPPNGANRGRFKHAQVDRLIEQAEREVDEARQADLYRQLQALLLQELPYVPLWYENQIFVSRSDIQGYHLASDGNYDGLKHVERRK